jgi:hypothetical protein
VLSSPVRLTVISIVGSLQKEAAPVKERPKSRRNAQGGHFCLAIRFQVHDSNLRRSDEREPADITLRAKFFRQPLEERAHP